MSGSDLGVRRRRALWRATHRGSKEMDFLLGRFAEQAVGGMNAAEIAVFERLIDVPDPAIETCVLEGTSPRRTE
jgi:antitoxin CptB